MLSTPIGNLRVALGICTGLFLVATSALADVYPWGTETVPTGILEDITKYYFYRNSSYAFNKRWGDLQVIVITERTLDGEVSGYYGITYFGEGDMPTLDGMLEWSRRSYEAKNAAIESGIDVLSTIFDEEVSDTDKEILLAWGADPITGECVFSFAFFRVSPRGFWFEHGGDGIPDCIAESYRAMKNVEEEYGVHNLKFEGPVLTCVEFTDGGRRYFARTSSLYRYRKTYSEEDIPLLNEGGLKLKNHTANGKTWETFFEELHTYKD
jgi:hypothetical protein